MQRWSGLTSPTANWLVEWAALDVPMFFGDVCRLPFADDSVDLVIGLEVLEHVPDTDRALAEIARVCSGTAVLSVPREPIWRLGNLARGRYIRHLGNTPGHINHWSARAFEQLLEQHFIVDQVERPLPWTMARVTPRRS